MYANGSTPRIRKERKVSVVFQHPDDGKHCAGVEALLFPSVPNHKLLFTASRDSTVKRWDVAGPEPVLEASFDGHADWVNDLALIGDLLITCSNDQTVRLWKAGSDNGQHLHTLSYHSDYVTCLAAAPSRGMVVSAGLRSEIFLLSIETGKHMQLYPRSPQPSHSSAPAAGSPASHHPTGQPPLSGTSSLDHHHQQDLMGIGSGGAGLPSMGNHNNMHGMGSGGSSGGGAVKGAMGSVSEPPQQQQHHPGSVYALALTPSGTVVAAGTSEALIRLLDPRSGKKITKLRGHQDTVRALLMNSDGTTLLSGASDGTIKLWDVGMQRCVQTYNVHSDSVWSLLSPDDSFSVIYSAGRDRALYRTYTHSRTSELLAVENGPVQAMALEVDEAGDPTSGSVGLWVATPESHVHKWAVPREAAGGAGAGAERGFSIARRSHGLTANLRNRSVHEPSRLALAKSPVAVVPGVPGIVAHEVLADRRHVLTKDSAGLVALWDVLQGAQVASYGMVDLAAKAKELWEARSVPSWFTCDNKLGCLAITLEPPSAFMAEEYAAQLDYANVPDDYKVNYGKLVLDCVFAKWRYKLAQSMGASASAAASSSGHAGAAASMSLPPSSSTSIQSASAALPQGHQGIAVGGGQGLHGSGVGTAEGGGGVSYYGELWPKYWQCRALPAVICSRHDGQRWRRLISSFDGSETEPVEVPTWVGDVVLRNTSVTPKEAKCAFILLPAEGSNLPSLMQSKLNAPRILQIHKVAHYCCSKLQEQNVQLEVRPFYLRRPPYAPPEPPSGGAGAGGRAALELTCNGVAVPYEMSLATVKKYIWKKSDDLVFHYRIRDPTRPAPPPALSAGG
ncbi:hypothetical protein Agub_g14276 [Astrephomene gubernaculifera]|uniref:Uncharacterized protein n=1 Tax=Astrephomene gubernaculifera TaxID=47775 RepID=A0AAD3HSZ8_9CHLO|nr:hypothetical protein Agub_g14276 [Astrephomene gubernaculifera]